MITKELILEASRKSGDDATVSRLEVVMKKLAGFPIEVDILNIKANIARVVPYNKKETFANALRSKIAKLAGEADFDDANVVIDNFSAGIGMGPRYIAMPLVTWKKILKEL